MRSYPAQFWRAGNFADLKSFRGTWTLIGMFMFLLGHIVIWSKLYEYINPAVKFLLTVSIGYIIFVFLLALWISSILYIGNKIYPNRTVLAIEFFNLSFLNGIVIFFWLTLQMLIGFVAKDYGIDKGNIYTKIFDSFVIILSIFMILLPILSDVYILNLRGRTLIVRYLILPYAFMIAYPILLTISVLGGILFKNSKYIKFLDKFLL